MNAKGKNKLLKSLTAAIQIWLDEQNPNGDDATDIGYISDLTVSYMAIAALNVLEASSEAQSYAKREGLLL